MPGSDTPLLHHTVTNPSRTGWKMNRNGGGASLSAMEQVRHHIPSSTTSMIEVVNEGAGRLRIARTADGIELCGIQLLPYIQRHGIGSAIIEDLKAQAAAAGIPLDLTVEKDNPDTRRLYKRLGLVQVGETEQESKLDGVRSHVLRQLSLRFQGAPAVRR
jgi:GNAT superfamily N-acetyltransferase